MIPRAPSTSAVNPLLSPRSRLVPRTGEASFQLWIFCSLTVAGVGIFLILIVTIYRAKRNNNGGIQQAQELADDGLGRARVRRDKQMQQGGTPRVEEQRVPMMENQLSEWVATRQTGTRFSLLPELVSVGVSTNTEREEETGEGRKKGGWVERTLAMAGLRRV